MPKPSKKIMPAYVLIVGVYGDCQVGIWEDFDKLVDYCKYRKLDPPDKGNASAMACGQTDSEGKSWHFAWIPKNCTVVTIAHECIHLAFEILKTHGVKVTVKNHEALAHLVSDLMRQMLNCRKLKDGKHKKGD